MALETKDAARFPWSGGTNGQGPRCDHTDAMKAVDALSAGCPECVAKGAHWLGLVVCQTCGWVACSDESPAAHARAHYEETDHPVVRAMEPESAWRWCYAHGRAV